MLSCMKYIVIIYNLIFWLLGVVILILSTYLYIASQSYVDFNETGHFYITPFLFFMVLGALMVVVGFLGCCGAIRESTCCLGTYFLFCVTMCVACGAALFWTIQNSDEVKGRIKTDIQKVIREQYGVHKFSGPADKLVDKIQSDMECCGAIGPSDWAQSKYNQNRTGTLDLGVLGGTGIPGTYNVPKSCCQKDKMEQCQNRKLSVAAVADVIAGSGIHQDGCIDKLTEFADDKWKWIIVAGGIIIGVQFFALLFACVLCCAISRADDK